MRFQIVPMYISVLFKQLNCFFQPGLYLLGFNLHFYFLKNNISFFSFPVPATTASPVLMPSGLFIQPPLSFQPTVNPPTVNQPTVNPPTVNQPTVNPPYFQMPTILQAPTLIQPSVVPTIGHPQTLIQPGFPQPIYQRQPVVLQPSSVLQNPVQPCVFYNQNMLREDTKVRNIFCSQKESRRKNTLIVYKKY